MNLQRTDAYHNFVSRYPDSEPEATVHSNGMRTEIMLGMRHDIVEQVLIGLYSPDGACRREEVIEEDTLKRSLGVLRVLPESALDFARQHADAIAR